MNNITSSAWMLEMEKAIDKNFKDMGRDMLKILTEEDPAAPVCECGAEKTYGPDTPFHSTWCPKYRTP